MILASNVQMLQKVSTKSRQKSKIIIFYQTSASAESGENAYVCVYILVHLLDTVSVNIVPGEIIIFDEILKNLIKKIVLILMVLNKIS